MCGLGYEVGELMIKLSGASEPDDVERRAVLHEVIDDWLKRSTGTDRERIGQANAVLAIDSDGVTHDGLGALGANGVLGRCGDVRQRRGVSHPNMDVQQRAVGGL